MKKYGVDFQYCLPQLHVNLLQSDYSFERVGSNGGYENRSIYLLYYSKNFDILKLENALDVNDGPIRPSLYINENEKVEAVDFKTQ